MTSLILASLVIHEDKEARSETKKSLSQKAVVSAHCKKTGAGIKLKHSTLNQLLVNLLRKLS